MPDEIKDIILALLQDEEVYVESLEVDPEMGRIQLTLDTDTGIRSETLIHLNRKIRKSEEFTAAGGDELELELSSPGIGSPLTLPRHFRKNISRNLKVEHRDTEVPSPLKGTLVSVSETGIEIDAGGKKPERYDIKFDDIIEAKVKLKW